MNKKICGIELIVGEVGEFEKKMNEFIGSFNKNFPEQNIVDIKFSGASKNPESEYDVVLFSALIIYS